MHIFRCQRQGEKGAAPVAPSGVTCYSENAMVTGGAMRTDLLPRGRGWRMGIAVLAVVLVGATSGAAVWHEEHAGDQHCAVCQLRPEPAATSFGAFHFGPEDTSEPVARTTLARGVASGHETRLPARAPPA